MFVKTATPANQILILTAEHLVFSLLGRAFFEFPDKSWIESLAVEAVFDEIPFAGQQIDMKAGANLLQAWSNENQSGLTNTAFNAIVADYTRLFIGPGEVLAPPWESVYFNDKRLTFQEQTLQVRAWFRRYNLESVKLKNEPDDHVGLEFAFLAHMAMLGISALEQKNEKTFNQVLEGQGKFLSEHPLKWVSPWSDLILEHAWTDFYRGLALVARGALLELSRILEVPLPEAAQS
jgi:TorA maturation chaperone TorD